jgi:hypothetical protein
MGRRRRWLQSSVLGLAAFASIATSKSKGWRFAADVANDAPGKPRIAFVEASQEPSVRLDNGELVKPLAGYYTGMWNGTARYLIPADRTLAEVWIGGGCGGCLSGRGCEAPADAAIKLLSIKPVTTWRRTARLPPRVETLGGDRTEILVVASHPIRFALTATGRDRYAFHRDAWIVIEWSGYPEGTTETTWSLEVIMEGLCPTDAACEPPADAKLTIGTPAHVKSSIKY